MCKSPVPCSHCTVNTLRGSINPFELKLVTLMAPRLVFIKKLLCRFGGPPQRDNFGPPQRGGFGGPPNRDNFGRRPDFNQQQAGQQGYNRQPYQQQQQGFQRRPGFNQDQGYNGRPGFNQDQGYNGRPDFNQRQDMGRVMGRDGGSPRRRRQFSVGSQHIAAYLSKGCLPWERCYSLLQSCGRCASSY